MKKIFGLALVLCLTSCNAAHAQHAFSTTGNVGVTLTSSSDATDFLTFDFDSMIRTDSDNGTSVYVEESTDAGVSGSGCGSHGLAAAGVSGTVESRASFDYSASYFDIDGSGGMAMTFTSVGVDYNFNGSAQLDGEVGTSATVYPIGIVGWSVYGAQNFMPDLNIDAFVFYGDATMMVFGGAGLVTADCFDMNDPNNFASIQSFGGLFDGVLHVPDGTCPVQLQVGQSASYFGNVLLGGSLFGPSGEAPSESISMDFGVAIDQ